MYKKFLAAILAAVLIIFICCACGAPAGKQEAEVDLVELNEKLDAVREIQTSLDALNKDLGVCRTIIERASNDSEIADTFIHELRTGLDDIDVEKATEMFPGIETAINTIKQKCETICDLLAKPVRTDDDAETIEKLSSENQRELQKWLKVTAAALV